MARDPDRPPLQPNDFFPSLPVPEPEEMSVEEIKAICDEALVHRCPKCKTRVEIGKIHRCFGAAN